LSPGTPAHARTAGADGSAKRGDPRPPQGRQRRPHPVAPTPIRQLCARWSPPAPRNVARARRKWNVRRAPASLC